LYPIERILYRSNSNDIFEEFELDYILLGQIKSDIKNIKVNSDEVEDIKFSDYNDLKNYSEDEITPWFKLIKDTNNIKEYFNMKRRYNLFNSKIINNLPIISFLK
jgi:isopentenyldiphosphate isomerase